ncbi:unnamed protein product [Arabidopsis lyrata]|uniref:Predicted protein n=1 Tax=Arabidopsis lyrata subsp. lyrata TaxID=81972 RepID=D7L469_ARALL|nr:predicted protein [Arabidopsis lyrata subsp. lyrata]CAH8261625.1 unnamed protein product [Arabidopsis lyrata]
MFQIRQSCLSGKFLGDASLFGDSVPLSAQFRSPLRPLRFLPPFTPPMHLVDCRSSSFSSSKNSRSLFRRASPPSGKTSSYFAPGDFPHFSPCRVDRLIRVMPVIVVPATSLPRDLWPPLVSRIDARVAPVNRRRRRMPSPTLGLGQFSRFRFRRMHLIWVGPIFGSSEFCAGPLSLLGFQLALCCNHAFLACPTFGHKTSSTPTTIPVYLLFPFCHPFAISYFSTQRFTGYFSGFPLPKPDTSPIGPVRFRSRTTFVGSDFVQIRRSLLTGYFSGVSLPVSLAVPGCSQLRTTFVGSNFNGSSSWCFVTHVLTANSRIVMSALVADSISCSIALCVFHVVQGVFSLILSSVIKVQGLHDDVYCLSDRIALIYPSFCFCRH